MQVFDKRICDIVETGLEGNGLPRNGEREAVFHVSLHLANADAKQAISACKNQSETVSICALYRPNSSSKKSFASYHMATRLVLLPEAMSVNPLNRRCDETYVRDVEREGHPAALDLKGPAMPLPPSSLAGPRASSGRGGRPPRLRKARICPRSTFGTCSRSRSRTRRAAAPPAA